MKKAPLYLVTAVSAISALTGCYPTGDKRADQENISDYVGNIEKFQDGTSSDRTESASESSGNIELDLENVKVSLTLPEYDLDSIKEFRVNRKEFEPDKLVDIFLNEEENTSLLESESDLSEGYTRIYYETENEKRLIYEPGFVTYDDFLARSGYSYSFIYSATFYHDMNEIFSSVEFDDFSRAEAKNIVESYLKEIGIDNYGEPDIFSITAEDANNYADSYGGFFDKHGDPLGKWTEEQQCYILVYPVVYNDIEFSISREVSITAIIRNDKLIQLSCDDMIDASTIEEKSIDMQYDAEQALNMVIDKYERMVIDDPVQIVDCKMSYIKKENSRIISQTYIPVWEFTLKSEYPDVGTRISYNYVDVQSGEIF
ncbi:MAG: hypothetical protein NC177_13660 [Ruminococcus flavefaciens]|nr:hypothetical protein [Ruminococcus flavefaciens]